MTELGNKIADRILDKMDLDMLIEKIGLEVLTDRIAEKAAEMIVKMEYPDTHNTPITPLPPPFNPGTPWRESPNTWPPITVMYGVTPVEFTGKQSAWQGDNSSFATTNSKSE